MRRLSWFNVVSLTVAFAFLYIPILLLVIFSFNLGPNVAIWTGWSTKWYASVFQNEQLMDAAWVTFRIAFLSATIATVLGTLAAITLTRFGRYRGSMLFNGMVYAPLVMPEIILGLSLLLLFVAIGFRTRLLDDRARTYHVHPVLRRRRRAVPARHLRQQP